MSGEKSENELSHWFSTYGVITAERILGKYHIKLAHEDLLAAVKSTFSFYHKLLEIPLKNVLNGIVMQQANDYHIYAQKLFIDYLLSGETSKDENAQGAGTREAMENERQQLVALGDAYHKKEGEHNNLIASSQADLIKITREFNIALEKAITSVTGALKKAGMAQEKSRVRQAINHALVNCEVTESKLQSAPFLFTEKMADFLKVSLNDEMKNLITDNLSIVLNIVLHFNEHTRPILDKTEEMTVEMNAFRTQFYETILRIMELIKLLPEYKIDAEQDAINRESLYFDKSIGQL